MRKYNSSKVICIISTGFMFIITAVSMILFQVTLKDNSKILKTTYNDTYRSYYAMIVDNPESEFWQKVYQKVSDIAEEENIYVEIFGNQLNRAYSRLELLQMAIDCKVDGIFLEADESDEMTKLINEAIKKDIPVITVIGDNRKSKRQSFVGISSYILGMEYGNRIVRLTQGSMTNVLLLMTSDSKDFGQSLIYSGLQEVIDETNQRNKVQIESMTIDDSVSFAAEESIRDIFMNQKELPDIIICLDEINTSCVYQAVIDYNKVGMVNIIGYYNSETILRGISRNVIDSTVAISTEQIARNLMESIVEFKAFGKVSAYYSVNPSMITKENVASYLEVQ